MNYYPHHIGDYAKDTSHLSMLEHGAYRGLIDVYYTREKPLPLDLQMVYRLARARNVSEKKSVDFVLSEFFVKTESGYTHKRCDEEIGKAKNKAETARMNGLRGGRPRTQEEPNDNPAGFQQLGVVGTQTKAYPITNNQEPNKPLSDDFEKTWKAYPRRLGDNPKRKALHAWSARLREGHSADEILAGVERYAAFCRATGKVGTETVKHAATFFGPDKAFLQPWETARTPEKKVAL